MSDPNTERAIGRLEGGVDALKDQIEELKQIVQAQGRASADERNELRLGVMSANRRLDSDEVTLNTIEPLAKDFGKLREKSVGFIYAVLLLWTLIGGLLMWLGEQVWTWIAERLTGGGP